MDELILYRAEDAKGNNQYFYLEDAAHAQAMETSLYTSYVVVVERVSTNPKCSLKHAVAETVVNNKPLWMKIDMLCIYQNGEIVDGSK